MRKLLNIVFITLGLLLLTSCASKSSTPADVTDANDLAGAQTQGLGTEESLYSTKSDVGPHEGLLATRSFYFDYDKNVVYKKDYEVLKAHAKYLLDHPTAKVLLEGNTDLRGSREYNIGLGQRRSNAVEAVLKMEGVPAKQIRTLSYGSEKPVALGHNEEAYRQNRRVDLIYEAK